MDLLRQRVVPLLKGEFCQEARDHLFAAAIAAAVDLGTKASDPDAAYQAVLVCLSEVLALVQAVSRRVARLSSADAPASLALVAYSQAHRVQTARQGLVDRVVASCHRWADDEVHAR